MTPELLRDTDIQAALPLLVYFLHRARTYGPTSVLVRHYNHVQAISYFNRSHSTVVGRWFATLKAAGLVVWESDTNDGGHRALAVRLTAPALVLLGVGATDPNDATSDMIPPAPASIPEDDHVTYETIQPIPPSNDPTGDMIEGEGEATPADDHAISDMMDSGDKPHDPIYDMIPPEEGLIMPPGGMIAVSDSESESLKIPDPDLKDSDSRMRALPADASALELLAALFASRIEADRALAADRRHPQPVAHVGGAACAARVRALWAEAQQKRRAQNWLHDMLNHTRDGGDWFLSAALAEALDAASRTCGCAAHTRIAAPGFAQAKEPQKGSPVFPINDTPPPPGVKLGSAWPEGMRALEHIGDVTYMIAGVERTGPGGVRVQVKQRWQVVPVRGQADRVALALAGLFDAPPVVEVVA